METIVIANQKGGVGKSTVSVHLAYHLVEQGKRVLFIDMDPQGNSTTTLEQYKTFIPASAMFRENTGKDIEPADFVLIPASAELVDLQREDWQIMAHLRENLAMVQDDFDYCLIDTAPTMGLTLTGALIAANYVLSPMEVEEYSLDGIGLLIRTIEGIKQRFNPEMHFLGLVVNRFNGRDKRQVTAFREIASKYGSYILPQPIAIRSSIPAALAERIPVWEFAKKNTAARVAAKEFRELFRVISEKMEAA